MHYEFNVPGLESSVLYYTWCQTKVIQKLVSYYTWCQKRVIVYRTITDVRSELLCIVQHLVSEAGYCASYYNWCQTRVIVYHTASGSRITKHLKLKSKYFLDNNFIQMKHHFKLKCTSIFTSSNCYILCIVTSGSQVIKILRLKF
jgi:hypothetical protein